MKLIIKLLVNAIAVFIISYLLRNNGVTLDSYLTAIIVAVVLSVLNLLVKPVILILTLPITIITLGLFLLIINAFIIIVADKLIIGFSVSNIWIALLFSILLSVLQSVLHTFLKEDQKSAS